MGLFGSLLKMGATIGASAIPGVGAIAGPVVAGALSGQPGILGKVASAGTSYGLGKLGDALKGADQAGKIGGGLESGVNRAANFTDQFDISQLAPDDMLGKISVLDILKQQNGGFGGGL